MKHTPLILAVAIATATPALADTKLEAQVKPALRHYAPQVQVSDLTPGQMNHIYSIAHSRRSEGDKRRLIRSVAAGPGLLERLFSRSGGS